MGYLLLITSSLHGASGHSTRLAGQLAQKLADDYQLDLKTRNLAKESLPHLSEDELHAWQTPTANRSPKQARMARLSDKLIEELRGAEIVVLATPMYNFGVPSCFKAWIDRITRPGITFMYTNEGSVGLLDSRPVHIICTRGGFYCEGNEDYQTMYLRKVLSFIGLNDIRFIYAEGLNTEDKTRFLHEAKTKIANIN